MTIAGNGIAGMLRIAADYRVRPNITYFAAAGCDIKLDVFQPRTCERPRPTLMFVHGGGWRPGYTKEMGTLQFLPFLHLGWIVVNVEYRHSGIASAPAAVEDCLRALQWVGRNAGEYRFDLKQLVVGGVSAGGHLALMAGMIPPFAAGSCESNIAAASLLPADLIDNLADVPRPAAIVSWSGITDVSDLLEGPNQQEFALLWLGQQTDKSSIAKLVSPLTYVRADLPPIVSVHGTDDAKVPFRQASQLHEALSGAGVANRLIAVHGGGHDLTFEAHLHAYPQIFQFLRTAGLPIAGPGSGVSGD